MAILSGLSKKTIYDTDENAIPKLASLSGTANKRPRLSALSTSRTDVEADGEDTLIGGLREIAKTPELAAKSLAVGVAENIGTQLQAPLLERPKDLGPARERLEMGTQWSDEALQSIQYINEDYLNGKLSDEEYERSINLQKKFLKAGERVAGEADEFIREQKEGTVITAKLGRAIKELTADWAEEVEAERGEGYSWDDPARSLKVAVIDAARNAPNMATSMALGKAGGILAMANLEAQGFKDGARAIAQEQGIELDENELYLYSVAYGLLSGAIENASNIYAGGKFGFSAKKKAAETALQSLKKVAGTTVGKRIVDRLMGGLSEGLEEFTQGGLQRFLANKMFENAANDQGVEFKPTPLFEGSGQEAASGFFSSLITGGVGLPVEQSRINQSRAQLEALGGDTAVDYENVVSDMGPDIRGLVISQNRVADIPSRLELTPKTFREELMKLQKEGMSAQDAKRVLDAPITERAEIFEEVVLPQAREARLKGLQALQEEKTARDMAERQKAAQDEIGAISGGDPNRAFIDEEVRRNIIAKELDVKPEEVPDEEVKNLGVIKAIFDQYGVEASEESAKQLVISDMKTRLDEMMAEDSELGIKSTDAEYREQLKKEFPNAKAKDIRSAFGEEKKAEPKAEEPKLTRREQKLAEARGETVEQPKEEPVIVDEQAKIDQKAQEKLEVDNLVKERIFDNEEPTAEVLSNASGTELNRLKNKLGLEQTAKKEDVRSAIAERFGLELEQKEKEKPRITERLESKGQLLTQLRAEERGDITVERVADAAEKLLDEGEVSGIDQDTLDDIVFKIAESGSIEEVEAAFGDAKSDATKEVVRALANKMGLTPVSLQAETGAGEVSEIVGDASAETGGAIKEIVSDADVRLSSVGIKMTQDQRDVLEGELEGRVSSIISTAIRSDGRLGNAVREAISSGKVTADTLVDDIFSASRGEDVGYDLPVGALKTQLSKRAMNELASEILQKQTSEKRLRNKTEGESEAAKYKDGTSASAKKFGGTRNANAKTAIEASRYFIKRATGKDLDPRIDSILKKISAAMDDGGPTIDFVIGLEHEGEYIKDGRKILVNDGLSPVEKARTVIHEIVHDAVRNIPEDHQVRKELDSIYEDFKKYINSDKATPEQVAEWREIENVVTDSEEFMSEVIGNDRFTASMSLPLYKRVYNAVKTYLTGLVGREESDYIMDRVFRLAEDNVYRLSDEEILNGRKFRKLSATEIKEEAIDKYGSMGEAFRKAKELGYNSISEMLNAKLASSKSGLSPEASETITKAIGERIEAGKRRVADTLMSSSAIGKIVRRIGGESQTMSTMMHSLFGEEAGRLWDEQSAIASTRCSESKVRFLKHLSDTKKVTRNAKLGETISMKDNAGDTVRGANRAMRVTMAMHARQADLENAISLYEEGGSDAINDYLDSIENKSERYELRKAIYSLMGVSKDGKPVKKNGRYVYDPDTVRGWKGRLDRRYKFSARDILNQANSLTKEESDFIDQVARPGFDMFRPDLQAAYKDVNGRNLNMAVNNYIPMVRDYSKESREQKLLDKLGTSENPIYTTLKRQTLAALDMDNNRTIKSRGYSDAGFVWYGIDELLSRYGEDTSKYIGTDKFFNEWKAAVQNNAQSIDEYFGKRYRDHMQEILDRAEGVINQPDKLPTRIANATLSRFSKTILQSPKIVLYQPLSATAFGREFGFGNLAKALPMLATTSGRRIIRETRKFAQDLELRKMETRVETDYLDSSNYARKQFRKASKSSGGRYGVLSSVASAIDQASDYAMLGIRTADTLAIDTGILTAYQKITSENPNLRGEELYREVANQASRAVNRTQVSGNPMNMTAMRLDRNPIMRVVSYMSGATSAAYNMLARDINAVRVNGIRDTQSVKNLGASVTAILMQALLIAKIKEPEDEDGDENTFGYSFASTLGGYLPAGGAITPAVLSVLARELDDPNAARRFGYAGRSTPYSSMWKPVDDFVDGWFMYERGSDKKYKSGRKNREAMRRGQKKMIDSAEKILDVTVQINTRGIREASKGAYDKLSEFVDTK